MSYFQSATYWAPQGYGAEGEVFAAPVAVNCRWENIAELFLAPNGEEATSRAVVYTEDPLVLGGYLLLGTSAAANPASVAGAFKIRQSVSIPDLRNVRSEHRSIL